MNQPAERPISVSLEFQADIDAIARIDAVPSILDVVCRTTGGFVAIARVTEDRWIACEVLDTIGFGLMPGDELAVKTTLCDEIRDARMPIVIDEVATDPVYCEHSTPAMYGFQSYISMPILLPDGTFFGTLCAIDPRPARLNNPETLGMLKLFAELIAFHLDANERLALTQAALSSERKIAEFREQFIAVLGHD
ncbi:MAG: GAF domain-containing protein, partial [Phyllobacterium sp.]